MTPLRRRDACVGITIAALCGLPGCSGSRSDEQNRASQTSSRETAAEETLPAPSLFVDSEYPDPSGWEAATEAQASRAARSFAKMKPRKVPVYEGPLFVSDDEVARIRDPQEAARRALVLWAVELRAEGVPRSEAIGLIEQLDLGDSLSPQERAFLDQSEPDSEQARRLVWRLEAIWVLLWALGHVDELAWPDGMCDVAMLAKIMKEHEDDPEFIRGAKLRSKSEIIDAQDLTMRIHWAIRDAQLRDGMIPPNLDWTLQGERIMVPMSRAVGVVEQRHYVLNWLVNYPEPAGWDDVDTPT